MQQTHKRVGSIDFCRGAAMIAVIIDHTQTLYPKFLVLHSIFSVTMFVLLGGITSCMSLEKSTGSTFPYIWKRIKPILLPYVIATMVYRICLDGYVFSLPNYLSSLLLFNASPPFYFIVFYLQLIAISPLLYNLINRSTRDVYQIVLIGIACFLSLLFTKYTHIGDVHGGGQYLLGGTYFYVFVIGMVCYKAILYINNSRYKISMLCIISLAALGIYEYLGWINRAWSNPPNGKAVLYSVIVAAVLFSSFTVAKGFDIIISKYIVRYIMMVGRNSLNIFLYHSLIINFMNKYKCIEYIRLINTMIKRIAFILLTAMIPICISKAYAIYAKFTPIHRYVKIRDILRGRQGDSSGGHHGL